MLNLHLQAAEQELVKIISLVVDLQVALGRRTASECSRHNGFFAREDHPTISRDHATLRIDANQRVGGYSVPQSRQAYRCILMAFPGVYRRCGIKAGNIHQWKTHFTQE